MELNTLKKFISIAKQNTYAATQEGNEKINEDYSREYQYQQGEFLYRDRYFGNDPFSGQEILYYNGIPVWSMSYYGNSIGESIAKNEIYAFLRLALSHSDEKYPFRGIDNHSAGKFRYSNIHKGDFLHFSGHESIYYKDNLVYSLNYFGGQICE